MIGIKSFASMRNAMALPRNHLPLLGLPDFQDGIIEAVSRGERVAAYFAAADDGSTPVSAGRCGSAVDLYIVLADSANALLHAARTRLESNSFPSLTPECPQVHLFEREIAEQFALCPEGHPWLKPVRFDRPESPVGVPRPESSKGVARVIGVTDFYRVEGEEIHEVGVGPVHAGIIEPGHFRFQCHGEHVFHLEISLGYQHRGVERSVVGGPDNRTIHVMETVAGDTTIGHTSAYCQALEALSGCQVPLRAEVLRGVALELERLANHVGDLGALAGDVGYLPTASYCGRIRGDFLNLTALLCGSRFGRSLVRPGGVGFDVEESRRIDFLARLENAYHDVTVAANLLWDASSVQARFENVGTVSAETADAIGLVGPAARASGRDADVRRDFPGGIFRFAQLPISTWSTGDVFARAYVRWLEIKRSAAFIRNQMTRLPAGPVRKEMGPLQPDCLVVSMIEGWRGEICHVALTDSRGRFARYKIVDPSFHNWTGLALALREQQISDFPLCNKSFNLSYCGHDL